MLRMLTAAISLSAIAAHAQYPEKPIRIVLPFAVGGGVDALVRPLAKEMSDILGKPVIIDSKPSATGQTGMQDVARSAPNGYTIVVSSAAYAITPALYRKLPYNTSSDFAPITIIASNPLMLVATKNLQFNNAAELIAAAKKGQPVNFASPGISGVHHLAAQLMANGAGVRWTSVPYKGAGNAFQDLIGGQVDVMFDNPGSSLPLVQAGNLKLLATTGLIRSPVTPNTPTISESIPGFDASNWFVFAAPAGTPESILEKLHAATVKALSAPAVKDMMARNGITPVASSPKDATAFVNDELKKWAQVVDKNNLQLE